MDKDVLIALITTLGGGGSVLVAAFKIVPTLINSRKTKMAKMQKDLDAILNKTETLTHSINKLTDLVMLSLQVHKVELKGIKQGGLNGECQKWSETIDTTISKIVTDSIKEGK